MQSRDPELVGVIHLMPLPGSPRAVPISEAARSAARCAKALSGAGYATIMVENFGDAPFFADVVPPVTVAAMTTCALAVREAAPDATVGINVLRNDAAAALSIAACVGAKLVRVNVHTGARVTDQGIVEGRAASTLRLRRELGIDDVQIWADVDVKHSAPLGRPRDVADEVGDLTKRGLADAVLVTGEGTGKGVDLDVLEKVRAAAAHVPILVASGATIATLPSLSRWADGVIVGTALRIGGVPGTPVDADLARAFADAFFTAFATTPGPDSLAGDAGDDG